MAIELAKKNSFGDKRDYHKPGVVNLDFHNKVLRFNPHSYPDETARRDGVAFQKILESFELNGEDWDNHIEPVIQSLGATLYAIWKEKKAENLEGSTDLM